MTAMPPPPPVEAPTGVGEPAGFWRRFAGSIIDGIVVGVVETIFAVILGRSAGYGVGLIVSAAYFTYFHGRTGQTPGNAVLGIRVVDVRDNPGQPIGYGRAFVRWLVSIVSAIVIFLGYLWMLWDPQKQTWHDKAAGSVPIKLAR
jgi:uncharacterized RDD family membrane protein YckC